MLLINPHISFFFRGEVHVVSEEGLNAYGAVTWGQFLFIKVLMKKQVGCIPPQEQILLTNLKKP